MQDRSCEDCGYCKEHLNFSYCTCPVLKDSKPLKTLNYKKAKTCEFYDDDSWMK